MRELIKRDVRLVSDAAVESVAKFPWQLTAAVSLVSSEVPKSPSTPTETGPVHTRFDQRSDDRHKCHSGGYVTTWPPGVRVDFNRSLPACVAVGASSSDRSGIQRGQADTGYRQRLKSRSSSRQRRNAKWRSPTLADRHVFPNAAVVSLLPAVFSEIDGTFRTHTSCGLVSRPFQRGIQCRRSLACEDRGRPTVGDASCTSRHVRTDRAYWAIFMAGQLRASAAQNVDRRRPSVVRVFGERGRSPRRRQCG
ncbi:hypothetical protein BCO18442_05865 [Burkholderia contaminans]|nr:hypothetical protein BCO18442_05865 [Burkholderia contaminans]